ncbi:heptaprenyl diphosphate synthase component 1 [Oceanobacillus bengalensis]|uniref:heptaprenyl diphosphate synthase component 1 n=1 Tax=Oceanobacillus bengalensis TaxID=1435466 RepID=UPI00363845E9
MNTSNIELQTIKKIIEENLRHKYIEKFIGNPIINDEKLLVLSLLINRSSLSAQVKERYILACVLVQVALDTHQEVPLHFHSEITKDEKVSNQLRVLAGDYYSSLYYLLLAEIEDLEMIQLLSTAIKEINESKMKLYYMKNDSDSIEEYINTMKTTEFLLIHHIAEHLKDDSLNAISSEWIIIERLIHEKKNVEEHRESQFVNTWTEKYSSYFIFIKQLETIIRNKTLALNELIEKTPALQATFKDYLIIRLSDINNNTSIVEEG